MEEYLNLLLNSYTTKESFEILKNYIIDHDSIYELVNLCYLFNNYKKENQFNFNFVFYPKVTKKFNSIDDCLLIKVIFQKESLKEKIYDLSIVK